MPGTIPMTPAQANFLRSANEHGLIYISRQTYSGRSLGGKAVEMGHRLADMGLLTLEHVEFRNTAKCAAKDHTFRVTRLGVDALSEYDAQKARTRALIAELIAEAV
jgi:hypothetical protein